MKIRRIAVADCETSGVDTENDRIIQFFIGLMDQSGEWIEKREWLIDPGIDVPQGASDVHGYTTERLRAEGRKDWEKCIQEIGGAILSFTGPTTPIAFFNGSFDLSMLDAEMRRAGYKWSLMDSVHDTVNERGERIKSGLKVVDAFIIDKYRDKYRKGSRKLVDVAPIYDVPVEENAHDAQADCLMTGRIALKQLAGYRGNLNDLHNLQVGAAREQRLSLESYFMESGKKNDDGSDIVIEQGWPWYDSAKKAWESA